MSLGAGPFERVDPTIGISAYPSNAFPQNNWFVKSTSGNPAQSLTVTVNVEELAKAAELRFATRRRGPQFQNSRQELVTMRDGQLTVTINPVELVTLRSNSQ